MCYSYFFLKLNQHIRRVRHRHYRIYLLKCLNPGRTFRPPDPTGTCRKQAEKSPDSAGMHRKSLEVEAVFQWEFSGFFSGGFQPIFCAFGREIGRKSSEKTRKFSGGNTASMFWRFPVSSCRNRPVFF